MRRRTALLLFGMVLFACGLAACSGGDDSGIPTEPTAAGEEGGASSAMGTLRITMTDAPADEICELHVYVRDLRVKPDGEPQMLLGADIGGFDLLALQDGRTALLGDFQVARGRYQFIEILLDQGLSYVVEKEDPSDPANMNCLESRSPLQVPSEKFKVNGGPFDVEESTEITIDFDAHKSLKKTGGNSNKGWQLKPDVSIVNVAP